MSASPAPATGSTPNGAPKIPLRKKPKPADPMRAISRKPAAKRTIIPGAAAKQNSGVKQPLPSRPGPNATSAQTNGPPQTDTQPEDTRTFHDYPVVTTKRAFLEGLRHHVIKFQSRSPSQRVDPTDQSTFTRPVRLHRRDPRAPPSGAGSSVVDVDMKDDGLDDKEREKQEAIKAERLRIREENQAQIAPTGKQSRPQNFNKLKKTEQVYRTDDSPAAKKAAQLRYEEAMPWHLEDFDNKNTWVGQYEANLSGCHVMLHTQENATFRMIPVEKWYRFKEKYRKLTVTADEADERMTKLKRNNRWLVQADEFEKMQEAKNLSANKQRRMFTRAGANEDEKPSGGVGLGGDDDEEKRDIAIDADDIDVDAGDEFSDDEENALFEGDDEEGKVAEEKIRREQLSANIFGLNDKKDVDKEEEQMKEEARMKRKLEKGTRKALLKRENDWRYDTDSDSNPYTSASDSDSSENEEDKDKQAESKKEEEAKAADKAKGIASGASTKGTNTPTNRPPKSLLEQSRKTQSTTSLKRPGSPNLSEASGNESSRKKHKHKHQKSSIGSVAGSPRELSPEAGNLSRKSSIAVGSLESSKISDLKRRHGSGSDSESGDGKGVKLKLRGLGSVAGSPTGSRAGSPTINTGRATSPGAASATSKNKASALPALPTTEEIAAAVPASGIPLSQLITLFKARIKSSEQRHDFIVLVKAATRFDKATKNLYPKNSGTGT
ncbi:hypothetical protein M501DRAFT_994292 [Patellaria atrata CBS 101060]|uniref:Transcription initiation factor IIF subunit alpha n=1 Tax=Patellaria atrata CBS 101060 TaxID=1346257 RepID=A0A9P4SIN6_9PEZI|nr:hypothetical protein M501DRAFT_994292 [Patellaria atrata CBS 101060]